MAETCIDCGCNTIPGKTRCYVGRDVKCIPCATAPPKRITVFVDATGHWWWNASGGGKPVEYIRADIARGDAQKGA